MTTLTESNGIQIKECQPGTWGTASLAGLPHLLMGLLIGVCNLGNSATPFVYIPGSSAQSLAMKCNPYSLGPSTIHLATHQCCNFCVNYAIPCEGTISTGLILNHRIAYTMEMFFL